MLRLKLNLIILLLPLSFILGQSYQITYEHVISFGADLTVEQLSEVLLKRRKNNQQELSVLTFTNGASVYQPVETLKEFQDAKKLNTSNFVNNNFVYKDQKLNKLIKFYKDYEPLIYGKDIVIKEKLPDYNWELLSIKDTIAGYPCMLAKATSLSGAPVLAWYTDQIPINDGPRGFWGLPGLILQAQINERVLIAATNIKQIDKEVVISFPDDKNAINTKEFKDLVHDIFEPRTITTPDGRTITVGRE